ncbi:hypothetical protein GCM10027093_15550 [Paraburkholderia jirisanensis]
MFGFDFSDLDSLYLHSMYDSVDRWVDGARVVADIDDRDASDAGHRHAHTDEVDHV